MVRIFVAKSIDKGLVFPLFLEHYNFILTHDEGNMKM